MGALSKMGIGAKREGSGEVAVGEEEDADAVDMKSAKLKAAQTVLDALKSRDAQALSAALEDHYACCMDEE